MAAADELKQEAALHALAKAIADLVKVQRQIRRELRELHDHDDED